MARAGVGRRDKQLKMAGGGGGRSKDVSGYVAEFGADSRRCKVSSRRTMQQHGGGADDTGKRRDWAAEDGAAA